MSFCDREVLEQAARECVPADDYYELLDCISEMSDEDLTAIPGVRSRDLVG